MLKSYNIVLHSLGLDPEQDTHFYRILLKLSLDKQESDWWARMYRELVANARWVGRCGAVISVAHCLGSLWGRMVREEGEPQ